VAATKFQYIVKSVSFTTDTAHHVYPVVKFSVVDPTNSDAPYNILTAAAFAGIDPSTGKPVCATAAPRDLRSTLPGNQQYYQLGSGRRAPHLGATFSLNPLNVGAAPPRCPHPP